MTARGDEQIQIDKAEVREKLFSGFGIGDIWTRISNPHWGPDNWIYAACGISSGGTIRGPHLKKPVRLGKTCFRFKPDGSRFEPVSGGTRYRALVRNKSPQDRVRHEEMGFFQGWGICLTQLEELALQLPA